MREAANEAEEGSRGVMYCVSGTGCYLDEARRSAESVRRYCPGIPIALFTAGDPAAAPGPWDEVRPCPPHRPERPFLSRLAAFAATPFTRTLALDTDTLVVAGVSDLFRLLDRFDLAAAQLPYNRRAKPIYKAPDVPDSFTEYNCGVLLFRRTPAVAAFLADWARAYAEDALDRPEGNDQVYFRRCLYHSDLRVATLQHRYNVRYHWRSSEVFDDVLEHWRRWDREQPSAILHDRRLIDYVAHGIVPRPDRRYEGAGAAAGEAGADG